MDRFSAYLLVRRHLKRPESRNQALAVEAIMEDLGRQGGGEPGTPWGVLGLLSQLDLEYAEQNPERRGRTAREQAELEGLPAALSRHLEQWCRHLRPEADPTAALAPVEHALLAATELAAMVLARRESDDALLSMAQELELSRGRGDRRGDELDRALEALGLTAEDAARLALDALRRVEQDLR